MTQAKSRQQIFPVTVNFGRVLLRNRQTGMPYHLQAGCPWSRSLTSASIFTYSQWPPLWLWGLISVCKTNQQTQNATQCRLNGRSTSLPSSQKPQDRVYTIRSVSTMRLWRNHLGVFVCQGLTFLWLSQSTSTERHKENQFPVKQVQLFRMTWWWSDLDTA